MRLRSRPCSSPPRRWSPSGPRRTRVRRCRAAAAWAAWATWTSKSKPLYERREGRLRAAFFFYPWPPSPPRRRAAFFLRIQKRPRLLDRLHEANALHRDARRKGAAEARRQARIEQHEDAVIVGAADQAAECLLQPQPRQHVVIGGAAELLAACLVQDVGSRPGHAVEDDEAERATGHVDAVAHRIGAEQAGILLGPEDVDERRGLERVDMLCQERDAGALQRLG